MARKRINTIVNQLSLEKMEAIKETLVKKPMEVKKPEIKVEPKIEEKPKAEEIKKPVVAKPKTKKVSKGSSKLFDKPVEAPIDSETAGINFGISGVL